MTQPPALDEVIADAYRKLALAGSDMRRVTELLERARTIALAGAGPVETTEAFGDLIATAARSETLECLVHVRGAVCAAKLEVELARLREAASRNAEAGGRAWRHAVAKALGAWHVDLADRYARADIGVKPPDHEEMIRGVAASRTRRWRESLSLWQHLGADPTMAATVRARVLATSALIYTVVLNDKAFAKIQLAEAEALDGTEWRVAYCRGRMSDAGEAMDNAAADAYRQANELAKGRSSAPLISLGDLEKAKGDLVTAERYYLQACACPISPSDGYSALIALAGHPTLFQDRRTQIEDLVRRASLLADNEQETYDPLLDAAEALRSNEDVQGFYDYVERAITFDPSRIHAYLNRGYARLDLNELETADRDFDQVIALAPGAPDGWWGKARIAQERKDWAVLRDSSLKASRLAPDWSKAITGLLEDVASRLSSDEPEWALQLYTAVREELGAPYEAKFQANLGDLHFSRAEYPEAVRRYRLAINAEPTSARCAAHLAMGLERAAEADPQADYREAYALAREASDREPANIEFTELRERLKCRSFFVARFGMAARALEQYTARLRVLIDPSLSDRFVEEESVRSWVIERIAALRSAIEKSHGFTLPGVRFAFWPQGEPPESLCLEIQGERVWTERFVDAPSDLFGPLEDAIRARLPAIFGYEEAWTVAWRCGQKLEQLDSDLPRVNAIAATGRALLAQGKKLECSDLPGPSTAAKPNSPSESAVSNSPESGIVLRHGVGFFDQDFPRRIQESVFARTGVVVPLVFLESDTTLPPHRAMLVIGGTQLNGPIECSEKVVADTVAEHAFRLLDPVAVAHHLLVLEKPQPVLVKMVRGVLGLSSAVEKLRTWLREGKSIRNLGGVLESLVLAEAPAAMASGQGKRTTPLTL